jgi:hypothetical protein
MMEKRATLSEPLESLDEEAPTIAQSDTEFKKFKAGRKDMMKQQVMEMGLARAPAPQPEKEAKPENPQTHRPGEGGSIVSSYDTAVMSVPVSIPVSGQLYRFAKTAVRQEPLFITIIYTQDWIMSSIGWFIFFVVMAVLFIFRKRLHILGQYIQKLSRPVGDIFHQLKLIMRKACEATLTPLLLTGLIIVAVFTHHIFLALVILLTTLCIAGHQRSYWLAGRPDGGQHRPPADQELPEAPSPEEEAGSEPETGLKGPAPESVLEEQPKRKWLWSILFGLGIILFVGLLIISSIGRYPNYRLIFWSGLLVISYYAGLFIWWFVHKMRMK